MAIETRISASEVAILSRLVQPDNGTLSPAAARAWLKIDFDDEDRARMHELAQKAQAGKLSKRDKVELESYRRVGCLLDMMHSKSRCSLKKRRTPA
jgi:hypothetical protein